MEYVELLRNYVVSYRKPNITLNNYFHKQRGKSPLADIKMKPRSDANEKNIKVIIKHKKF